MLVNVAFHRKWPHFFAVDEGDAVVQPGDILLAAWDRGVRAEDVPGMKRSVGLI
jgi:hypothetical protein